MSQSFKLPLKGLQMTVEVLHHETNRLQSVVKTLFEQGQAALYGVLILPREMRCPLLLHDFRKFGFMSTSSFKTRHEANIDTTNLCRKSTYEPCSRRLLHCLN